MKDQEQRLLNKIKDYYTTTGKLRDLLDACEDYLRELEFEEFRKAGGSVGRLENRKLSLSFDEIQQSQDDAERDLN